MYMEEYDEYWKTEYWCWNLNLLSEIPPFHNSLYFDMKVFDIGELPAKAKPYQILSEQATSMIKDICQ